ncbi:unnamed protein product, partial [Iphiclides podalirius]
MSITNSTWEVSGLGFSGQGLLRPLEPPSTSWFMNEHAKDLEVEEGSPQRYRELSLDTAPAGNDTEILAL